TRRATGGAPTSRPRAAPARIGPASPGCCRGLTRSRVDKVAARWSARAQGGRSPTSHRARDRLPSMLPWWSAARGPQASGRQYPPSSMRERTPWPERPWLFNLSRVCPRADRLSARAAGFLLGDAIFPILFDIANGPVLL